MGIGIYIIVGMILGVCAILGIIWGNISEIKKLLKKDKDKKGGK